MTGERVEFYEYKIINNPTHIFKREQEQLRVIFFNNLFNKGHFLIWDLWEFTLI
jgi:hypothetical protein